MSRTRTTTAARSTATPAPATPGATTERTGATFRILSLDGGGIRGIMSALWLKELQSMLGSPLRDHFHIIAGTSTGSILACAVAQGMEPQRIVDLYEQRGADIFSGPAGRAWSRLTRVFSDGLSAPKHEADGLERELKRAFTPELRFGDLGAMTLVTGYDTFARQTRVFKSWRHKEGYASVPAWEIVKSSCSAPTYFPAHRLEIDGVVHSMVDGGVAANNPSVCAIAEGVRLNAEKAQEGGTPVPLSDFVVASFGTGEMTRPIAWERAREMGALEWAVPIIDVLMDASGDATRYICGQLIPQGNCFRAQTKLNEAYDDMDNASPPNMRALKATAMQWLRQEGGMAALGGLAARLTQTRKAT